MDQMINYDFVRFQRHPVFNKKKWHHFLADYLGSTICIPNMTQTPRTQILHSCEIGSGVSSTFF